MLVACSDDDAEPTASTVAESTVPSFTGAADSPFCTLLRDLDVDDVLGDVATTPADVETGFVRLVAVLDEAAGLAPQDIRDDVELVAEGIAALDEALAATGYDIDVLAATPDAAAVVTAVNDPAFTVAGDRIEAYRTQVCQL